MLSGWNVGVGLNSPPRRGFRGCSSRPIIPLTTAVHSTGIGPGPPPLYTSRYVNLPNGQIWKVMFVKAEPGASDCASAQNGDTLADSQFPA